MWSGDGRAAASVDEVVERSETEPRISVVMAMRDASDTVADALASVRAQTEPRWEAVVVDDGSRDGGTEVVRELTARDGRIRLLEQQPGGVSAARNAGLAAAHGEWALFLDADDWLEPRALELLAGAAAADPGLDAIYGAWARVGPDAVRRRDELWPRPAALFAELARRPVFAVNSCLFRRALFEIIGPFDPSLATCEDWDFWQRLARTEARFAAVGQRVARYRVRPGSASLDGRRMLADAIEVIARGHSSDPRVLRPHPDRAQGRPPEQAPGAMLLMACWCAGRVLKQGGDPRALLEQIPGHTRAEVEPAWAGEALLDALTVDGVDGALWSTGKGAELDQRIVGLLDAVQERCDAPGWSRRAQRAFESGALMRSGWTSPLRLGRSRAAVVELSEPLEAVLTPPAVDRVQLRLELEGAALGRIELPVSDGEVPADVVADAAAAAVFWPVLGRFFARRTYPDLLEREGDAHVVRRRGVELASGLSPDHDAALREAHERAGWAVLLQELWDRPDRPVDWFYDAEGRMVIVSGSAPGPPPRPGTWSRSAPSRSPCEPASRGSAPR